MRYIKTLFFLFILIFSFVAPYKAYVNDIPSFQQKTIDVYPGESINSVIDKFSSHNLINKIFIRIFLNLENISDFKTGEYSIDSFQPESMCRPNLCRACVE